MIAYILLSLLAAPHRWYAAPSPKGSAAGSGTIERPWDLGTALAGGNGKVQPGDTVWLRGGTYRGTFTASLAGGPGAPVVVRQYPGERATIDGGGSADETFTVDGRWAVYWGFEIMQSGTGRWCADCIGLRPTGVYVRHAAHVKLVNLIVHDVGHGTFTENDAHDIEIYGWIIYNGGNENRTRSDGHGIYVKNDGEGWKVVRDNVIFNQFGFGIHAYTEAATGSLRNIVLDGNVLFDNGTVSSFDENPNLQLGGNAVADNDSVTDNLLYFAPWVSQVNAKIGYSTLQNGTALFTHNYIVGAKQPVEIGHWSDLVTDANTVADRGAAPAVFVRPNRYEPGRATVVIYNWPRQATVAVDLGGVVRVGAGYVVHNVQDLFGAPVASGVYRGGSVDMPMRGVTPPPPIGGSPKPPIRTGPGFDVFLVMPLVKG
jgi:hypothetical protein